MAMENGWTDQAHGLTADVTDHVLTLRIDSPETLNALTQEMMAHLGDLVVSAEEADDVRVVLVTGTGDHFCAGANLGRSRIDSPVVVPPVRPALVNLHSRLVECSKPTIAALNGGAGGGGLGIALACDIRLAREGIRVSTAFNRIGLPAHDGMPWMLPRIVDLSTALELLYLSEPLGIDRALELGLVNHVYPRDDFEARVSDYVRRIATLPPYATRLTKRLVMEGLTRPYAEYAVLERYALLANQTAAPHDITEGVTAFLERRQASFRGPVRPAATTLLDGVE